MEERLKPNATSSHVEWGNVAHKFQTLEKGEVLNFTRLVTNTRSLKLSENSEVIIDKRYAHRILITGMPKCGKTTTINAVSSELSDAGIKHRIITERQPMFYKDFDDEYWSLMYNMAMANYGLSVLAANFHERTTLLFDRGLIDHLAFAQALQKLYDQKYGVTNSYQEEIDAFRNYLSLYIPPITGVIICNSSAQTSINRGCDLPRDLLELVSNEFENFPQTIAKMKNSSDPTITINIDIDSASYAYPSLRRSIYTLITWNNEGVIKA